jgi:hypothetical protein
MLTKRNNFVRDSAINFVRHIKKLGKGYDVYAYPKYCVIFKDMLETIDNLDGCSQNHIIDDDIPDNAMIGYPVKSQIRYYINLQNVVATFCDDDCFRIYFKDSKCPLYIHKVDEYERILKSLEDIC